MKMGKVEVSGLIVLFIGVVLLIFAFFNAYGFLTGLLEIIAAQDIMETFGEALAPLIAACIRVLYLGIMGWIGSILTIRGIQLLKIESRAPSETKQQASATTGRLDTEKQKVTT